jgi:hypothetical protein
MRRLDYFALSVSRTVVGKDSVLQIATFASFSFLVKKGYIGHFENDPPS